MAEIPQVLRSMLADRLRREHRSDLANVLDKCAEEVRMQCVCCRSGMVVERGCAKRWCPVCAPRITARRLDRMSRIAPRMQWPLAVTLTVQNKAHSAECITALKEQFRAFRRTDFWADRVKGGIMSFEVTHRGKGWHPHLHALVDCRWLAVATPEPTRFMTARAKAHLCKRAQYELSQVWGAYIQGKRAQVWVERAWGKALAETLKYCIKPSDLIDCACGAGEMIDEIDSGKAIGTFGNCHACSKDFVGMEEAVMKERECSDCGAKKSIVPNDCLARMMAEPRKLKEHWRGHLKTRYEKLGIVPNSPEMRNAMDEEDDWWNDE